MDATFNEFSEETDVGFEEKRLFVNLFSSAEKRSLL